MLENKWMVEIMCVYTKLAAYGEATSSSSSTQHWPRCAASVSQCQWGPSWPQTGCTQAQQHHRLQGKSRMHAVPIALSENQGWPGATLGSQLLQQQPSSAFRHPSPSRVYSWHKSTLKSLGWEAAHWIIGIFKNCNGYRGVNKCPARCCCPASSRWSQGSRLP